MSLIGIHQLPDDQAAMVERAVLALQQEAERYAVTAPKIELAGLQFTQVIDPGNQLPGYEGMWRNTRNERCGTLTINSDGSFYAEYDLFCAHPRDARWFVEMVTAWGSAESLRCEAQLIPSLKE